MLAAVSLQGIAPTTLGDLGFLARRPMTDYFTKIGTIDREPSPAAS